MTEVTPIAAGWARSLGGGAAGASPAGLAAGRVPLKAGMLTDDLGNLEAVHFVGVRCRDCGTTLLLRRARCENCSSKNLNDESFASSGVVYTFTIQRYPPPPPHVGPTPWIPRPVAWIDLDNGPRIMGPIAARADELQIGMRVTAEFVVGWRDELGREVVSFQFRPERALAQESR